MAGNKKNILYVSNVCSQKIFEDLFNTANVKPGQAVQKFHNLLIKGFAKNSLICNIEVISSLPITQSSHKNVFWKFKNSVDEGIIFNYVVCINLPIIKHIIIFTHSFIKFIYWGFSNRNKNNIILCDLLNISLTWSAFIYCKIFKKKIGVIVTDIPDNLLASKGLNAYVYKIIFSYLSHFDFYIGLTKQMNNVVNPKGKPFLIMEGLVDSNTNVQIKHQENCKKVIFYAGGVYLKNGIINLLNAFILINDPNIELHIYGPTDINKILIRFTTMDTRIKYFGVVSNSIIVNKLKDAFILINPRPTNENFTKYSFPSKNLEYMASGTPLLTTKLQGIPEEYYNFVYIIEDYSEQGIKNSIVSILNKPYNEIIEFGKHSREFVLTHKSNTYQAKKIINFLQSNH